MRRAGASTTNEIDVTPAKKYDPSQYSQESIKRLKSTYPAGIDKSRVGFCSYTLDISNDLKIYANSGAICIKGIWRLTNNINSPTISVACLPGKMGSKEIQIHCDFVTWQQSNWTHPKQYGSRYYLNNNSTTSFVASPVRVISQYVSMIADLLTEYWATDVPSSDVITTIRAVLHSLENAMTYPTYSGKKTDDFHSFKEKIAEILRTRDESITSSEAWNNDILMTNGSQFYEALSEIFTGDIEGGDELYHHSVFPDTDLVMWMIMFYHPNRVEYFTPFWLRAVLTRLIKFCHKTDISHMTNINDMANYIHSNVGHGMNEQLKKLAFVFKTMLFVLDNRDKSLSRNSLKYLLDTTKNHCKTVDGIVPSLITIYPQIMTYPDIDISIANAVYHMSQEYVKSSRQMFPIEIFLSHTSPIKLIDLCTARIAFIEEQQKKIAERKALSEGIHIPDVKTYEKTEFDNWMHGVSSEHRHYSSVDFIKELVHYLTELLGTNDLSKIREFLNGVKHLKNKGGRPVIGVKRLKSIIRHVYERKFHHGEFDLDRIEKIYFYLDITRSHNDTPHIQPMRKVLVRNAVQTLTTDVIVEKTKLNESTSTHFHPIEIRCLSDIIARQKSFQLHIEQTECKFDCCICLCEFNKSDLFNPHGSHQNMPVCKTCKEQLERTNAPCPACRMHNITYELLE